VRRVRHRIGGIKAGKRCTVVGRAPRETAITPLRTVHALPAFIVRTHLDTGERHAGARHSVLTKAALLPFSTTAPRRAYKTTLPTDFTSQVFSVYAAIDTRRTRDSSITYLALTRCLCCTRFCLITVLLPALLYLAKYRCGMICLSLEDGYPPLAEPDE